MCLLLWCMLRSPRVQAGEALLELAELAAVSLRLGLLLLLLSADAEAGDGDPGLTQAVCGPFVDLFGVGAGFCGFAVGWGWWGRVFVRVLGHAGWECWWGFGGSGGGSGR